VNIVTARQEYDTVNRSGQSQFRDSGCVEIEQTRMIMADARDGGLLNICKEIPQYMLRRLMVGGGVVHASTLAL